MKRKRRQRRYDEDGLGSRESWEFGYLFHARSWARNPSPPSSRGWPLSWVKHTINVSEDKLLELRGIDASLYIRFLRACFWYALLHTLTTFIVLFPIHVEFSGDDIPSKSMTRSSITSVVATDKGLSLLWIHVCLLFWVTLTWMATLIWVCHGAFRMRARTLEMASKDASSGVGKADMMCHPHPHPQHRFTDVPVPDGGHLNKGLRLRTIMVCSVPHPLRNERNLKEYFEYYMSRKLEKPSMGITSSTQPGFFNKFLAFLFIRAKRIPAHLPPLPLLSHSDELSGSPNIEGELPNLISMDTVPVIHRVVIVRKMTELASLLERREEVLRLIETAHIQLANKTLAAVKASMDRKAANRPFGSGKTRAGEVVKKARRSIAIDVEECPDSPLDETVLMEQLIEVLGPYVEEFGLPGSSVLRYKQTISTTSAHKLCNHGSTDSDAVYTSSTTPVYPPSSSPIRPSHSRKSIWEALHTLPRSSLDAYQPLVNLSHLFRGKVVPSIDYYTAKFNLLSSLITNNRAKASSDYDPVSTAFVTFADPAEARRACKYLAVHPNNPLACLVTMAPMYQDLDWNRVMKSSINVDFVKDWVVDLGVWGFTLFWLFPVSLLVGLVSIQNISVFWPSLKTYLDRHAWEEELIQSFLPTLLVSLLALLIPLVLLLIAKKAHTIMTLSALHDRIMTRYYKFLIVNVLVFFCVGTAALQSFLQSFSSPTRPDIIKIVADSFPTAGPFYVGWLIFTTAIHGGFEMALFGLPLIMYPSTRRQVTPRKRAVGIRPRTLNIYYWLPNHLLVIHVLLLFSVLNPFVLPFGALYFFIQTGVMKHQLIHVYAKHYEANGQLILIRVVRYSLDGLILAQAVFLAYMAVLRKGVSVGLAAFLIVSTSIIKILMTRICRTQFEKDDIAEAEIVCGRREPVDMQGDNILNDNGELSGGRLIQTKGRHWTTFTAKLPSWVNFYAMMQHKPPLPQRKPNHCSSQSQSISRLPTVSRDVQQDDKLDSEMDAKLVISPRHEPPCRGTSIKPGLELDDFTGNAVTFGPVVAHPSPIPWDDQTTVDLPYDNPYYTKPIDDVLWLPRNPCGILNLDDTIDLKVSLTTDVHAGQLGTWLDISEAGENSPDEITREGGDSKVPRCRLNAATSLLLVDGTEDIELPPVIARRVRSREDGIEQAAKFKRLSLPLSSRSISDGNGYSTGRARSSSMSILNLAQPRARSTDQRNQENGSRPARNAQAESVTAKGTGSIISLPSRKQNVHARVAIAQEVMAEEEAALVDRIEGEQAEAQKATATKSWLTSWMFHSSE